jgi:hypothetical protein
MTPCRLVGDCERFGRNYCLHVQGRNRLLCYDVTKSRRCRNEEDCNRNVYLRETFASPAGSQMAGQAAIIRGGSK